jgi:poly(A) polymerase Pap1
VLVKGANIPLAKFSVHGVKIDLVFADMASPTALNGPISKHELPIFSDPEYLLIRESV